MKALVVGILAIMIGSCTLPATVSKGTDPLGADIAVYRDADGQIIKQVRECDSKRVVVYYKK